MSELVGETFGLLKVIDFSGCDKYGHKKYKCLCKCGSIKVILGYNLTSGMTNTCGCSKTGYGELALNWKGGAKKNNLPLFHTYSKQLIKYQSVYKIIDKGLKLLGVECTYCGNVYVPTQKAVRHRLDVINGFCGGENNLYCSENCKKACPTYNQKIYPKGFKPSTSREVQPQLRKLVLERDNWSCQICEIINTELHCHHITGVELNPIESADVDNCITLCKSCHKKVHKLPDCGYHELRCL